MSKKFRVLNRRNQRGFTLIELMIVVALIGILVAIGYPSYQDYILKGNRAVAKAKLLDLMARQEQFFQDNKAYANDLTGLGLAAATMGADQNSNWVTAGASNSIYDFSVSAFDGATFTYTLLATAAGPQADDTKCGNLSVTDTGMRAATGPFGAECWE